MTLRQLPHQPRARWLLVAAAGTVAYGVVWLRTLVLPLLHPGVDGVPLDTVGTLALVGAALLAFATALGVWSALTGPRVVPVTRPEIRLSAHERALLRVLFQEMSRDTAGEPPRPRSTAKLA